MCYSSEKKLDEINERIDLEQAFRYAANALLDHSIPLAVLNNVLSTIIQGEGIKSALNEEELQLQRAVLIPAGIFAAPPAVEHKAEAVEKKQEGNSVVDGIVKAAAAAAATVVVGSAVKACVFNR